MFRRVSSRRAAYGRCAAGKVAPAPHRACTGALELQWPRQTLDPFQVLYVLLICHRARNGLSFRVNAAWKPVAEGSTHNTLSDVSPGKRGDPSDHKIVE
jgi:hypothetical protein